MNPEPDAPFAIHCEHPGCEWSARSYFRGALDAVYLEHQVEQHVQREAEDEAPRHFTEGGKPVWFGSRA